MEHSDGFFTGVRGHRIYFQTWRPSAEPRGVLLLVHGAGEHSSRYRSLAAFFVEQGWALAAIDHNGHGRSEGRPGYVEDFADYLADLRILHLETAGRFPDCPLFLLGHSLGGLIAGLYLLEHQSAFNGAVLSGPLIRTPQDPGAIQRGLVKLLSRLFPTLGLIDLDPAGVSRDKAVVKDYTEDPLVFHGRMSARQLNEMFHAMDDIQREAGRLNLPVLILHGGEDRMTDPAGSRILYERAGTPDKTLKIYPGLYHEVFNEPERETIMSDLLEWCETHRAV